MSARTKGYLLTVAAAILWATLGPFYKVLITRYGCPPLTVAFFRAIIASSLLLAFLALRRRVWLRVARRDLPFFALFGLVGVAGFFVIYVYAVHLTGIGMAVILMYTAPIWVTFISRWVFKEALTVRKMVALFLAFGGCVLVTRAYDLQATSLNLTGLLCGLGAGFSYGLYILFNKYALRKYNPWTTLLYALGFGACFLLPLQSSSILSSLRASPGLVLGALALGLGPTLGGNLCYVSALQYLPASEASILATLEPVTALLLAYFFFHEVLSPAQLAGGAFILLGVGILQGGKA